MGRNKMTGLLYSLLIIASLSFLAILVFVLPAYLWHDAVEIPENAFYKGPTLLFAVISGVPFYYAVIEAFMIVYEIGKNNSFSEINAKRLHRISLSSALFSAWYLVGAIAAVFVPIFGVGMYVILFLVIFLSAAFSAATAALSHLTAKAAEIKNENDMTV